MARKPRYQRSKVSHLYLDTKHGVYYARGRDAHGTDTWRSLSTKSFEIARARLAEKLAEMQNGKAPRPTNEAQETVGEVTEIYRARVQADVSLKPSSIYYRVQTLNAILRSWPALAQLLPAKITEDACLQWAKTYQKTVSAGRFNNTVGTLRDVFKVACELDLATQNPALKIGKVKITPKELTLPSRQQFHAIVEAIRNTGAPCAQDAADLVEFLAYSGCRITEASFVRWSDVDSKSGTIRIHGHEETGTKSGQVRSVPITPPMRDLLDRLSSRRHRAQNLDRVGKGFIMQLVGCPKALENACKKVGAKRITHHDLRHLFATRCIEAGVDIPTVSRWLGHKDGGALAMKTYGHLRDEHSQMMATKVTF
jgi:integrase